MKTITRPAAWKLPNWIGVGCLAIAALVGCEGSEYSRRYEAESPVQYFGDALRPEKAVVRQQAIDDGHIQSICAHKSLAELRLISTSFDASVVLPSIATLPNLRTLSLIEVPVSDTDLKALSQATNLETLELSQTDIRGDGLKHIAHLPLKSLTLRAQSLSQEALEAVASMKNLEHLEICVTNIHWANLPELASKDNLRSVMLWGGYFSFRHHGGLDSIRGAVNLNELIMSGENINDRTLAAISTLGNLQSLTIEHYVASDSGIELLAGLDKLRIANVPDLDFRSRNSSLQLADRAEEEPRAVPVRG